MYRSEEGYVRLRLIMYGQERMSRSTIIFGALAVSLLLGYRPYIDILFYVQQRGAKEGGGGQVRSWEEREGEVS